MSGWRFWQSVEETATLEAGESPLPGYFNGPADAYRHIVGAAELRRRFGWAIAYSIVTGNEVMGTHVERYPGDLRKMDDHNNAIGLAIGADAQTYEEVVRRARAAIDAGTENGGSGTGQTALWMPQERWRKSTRRTPAERTLPVEWPDSIPSAAGYRFGDERFGADRSFRRGTPRERQAALLERLAATPTEEWSEDDVRGVIGSSPYQNSWDAGHSQWRDRVRQYFEERTRNQAASSASAGEEECDGVADVRAYTRQGPSGPVQVRAHTRVTACD